jgi:hypothetical protein
MPLTNAEIEDFAIGFFFGGISAMVIGWWGVIPAALSGVLWMLGGIGYMETKAWRRLGCAFVVCLPFSLTGHALCAVISFGLQCAWQTVGYGEPDVNDPNGSWLGRLCGKYTREVWLGIYALMFAPLFLR